MKFYNGAAGNPRRVRIFIAEKGIDIEQINIDIGKGETRTEEFLAKNSLGELPILELDDGTIITESGAICRYLEEAYPDKPLLGSNSAERANIEMWDRRIEFQLFLKLSNIVQHENEYFADKVEQIPEFAQSQRRFVAQKWSWLNQEMSDGRAYIAGNTFSIADISAMGVLMASEWLKVAPTETDTYIHEWGKRVKARESWNA